MTAESREELISAYLDGELSDVQRAEVEKWLADSSELRQLHAELRAVRSGMQSLKRHQLDHDISAAVLRRAEQSVLRGTDPKPVAGTIQPAPTSWWNRGAGWRRVVWPALAVAAALVILVYDANRRPAEREVALAPEQDELAAAPESSSEARAAMQEESNGRDDLAPSLGLRAAPELDADDYRPQESAVELQRAGSPRSQRMLKDLAKPSTALPVPESAQRSAAGKESLDAPVGQMKAAGDLVFGCTPQFLRDREFEKMLDEKKIKWRRVGASETREKKSQRGGDVDKNESYAVKAAVDQPVRVTYFVNGTPEQAKGILADLEGSVRRRAGITDRLDRQYDSDSPLPPQSVAGRAGGKASGFTITLVAPAAAAPPAEPAAASPANESP